MAKTASQIDPSFGRFLRTEDTLWICAGHRLLFRSADNGLVPLLTYLDTAPEPAQGTTAYDRTVGNAAALLLILARCREVYSAVGSQLAVESLKQSGIACTLLSVVSGITSRTGNGMCPLEKASIGKSPQEFHEFLRQSIKGKPGTVSQTMGAAQVGRVRGRARCPDAGRP